MDENALREMVRKEFEENDDFGAAIANLLNAGVGFTSANLVEDFGVSDKMMQSFLSCYPEFVEDESNEDESGEDENAHIWNDSLNGEIMHWMELDIQQMNTLMNDHAVLYNEIRSFYDERMAKARALVATETFKKYSDKRFENLTAEEARTLWNEITDSYDENLACVEEDILNDTMNTFEARIKEALCL